MLDTPAATDRPLYMYVAPLYRRLLVIVICSLIAVPIVVIVVHRRLLGLPVQLDARVMVCIGMICLALLSLFRARIRVDEDGIAHRALIGWRYCRWAEILDRPPPTLCVGQGPWTKAPPQIRRLYSALHWLDEHDGLTLHRWLTPAGTYVHLPDIPSRFRMQVMGLNWLEVDTEGLKLEEDGHVRTWFWDDVRRVTINKEFVETPAAHAIRIDLCDGTWLSILNSTIACECSCQCRRDYLLQQFFRIVLRENQILIWSKRGEPSTVAEASFRTATIQSELRTGRRFAWGYGMAVRTLLFFGLAVGVRQCMQFAILLAACGASFGPILWFLLRQQRAERNMLQAFLDAHARSNDISNV